MGFESTLRYKRGINRFAFKKDTTHWAKYSGVDGLCWVEYFIKDDFQGRVEFRDRKNFRLHLRKAGFSPFMTVPYPRHGEVYNIGINNPAKWFWDGLVWDQNDQKRHLKIGKIGCTKDGLTRIDFLPSTGFIQAHLRKSKT